MFVWHEYENAAEAAQSLADAVADALQGALDEKGGAVLAVSGGRSPIAFFNALSQKIWIGKTSELPWQMNASCRPTTPTAIPVWCANTC